MNFRERCRAEGTRDVIFLFQRKEWIACGMPVAGDGEYGHDGEGIRLGDTDTKGFWEARVGSDYLTNQELSEMETVEGTPALVGRWHTERVFLTRPEGEAYGLAHAYNYPDGYLVYGICAEGSLVDVLRPT